MTSDTLQQLQNALDNSHYTVALCGSGCLKECGMEALKSQARAYKIEEQYGDSPEYLYTSAFFSSRPKQFFEFYKNEFLIPNLEPVTTSYALAKLEQEGKLQCIISSNVFNLSKLGGCKNVINFYGNIYENYCTHCGKEYSKDYILNASSIPLCEECGHIIRPAVAFFGDMIDNQLMTTVSYEIEKAELILLLGTSTNSLVYQKYAPYIAGKKVISIHEKNDLDAPEDGFVIYGQPKDIFKELGY